MSPNKDRPHIYVLPEDDANTKLAIGFFTGPFIEHKAAAQVKVLREAGGWSRLRDDFNDTHVAEMRNRRNRHRHMVLLVDFDEDNNRLAQIKKAVPDDLKARVFILGVWSEPEALRRAGLGSFEGVGRKLSEECRVGSRALWGHPLLEHNAPELDRMTPKLCPILFPEE